ncbi:MAG: hypothetical protein ACM3OO_10870 [Planctomycetaceae bacterium]
MAEPATRRARAKTDRPVQPKEAPEPQAEAAGAAAPTEQHVHEGGVCPVAWCPICLAVTAVQPLRPEVVEHLLKAGTELLLAFRGVLDARADDLGGAASDEPSGPTRLEKIDLG